MSILKLSPKHTYLPILPIGRVDISEAEYYSKARIQHVQLDKNHFADIRCKLRQGQQIMGIIVSDSQTLIDPCNRPERSALCTNPNSANLAGLVPNVAI